MQPFKFCNVKPTKNNKMTRIINQSPDNICVKDMEVGQTAIITNWSCEEYINLIIIKNTKGLHAIGQNKYWTDPLPFSENCRVRILKKGTQIEL